MTRGLGADVGRALRAAAVLHDEADRLRLLAARVASRGTGTDWSGPARDRFEAGVAAVVGELRLAAAAVQRAGDAAAVAARRTGSTDAWGSDVGGRAPVPPGAS